MSTKVQQMRLLKAIDSVSETTQVLAKVYANANVVGEITSGNATQRMENFCFLVD